MRQYDKLRASGRYRTVVSGVSQLEPTAVALVRDRSSQRRLSNQAAAGARAQAAKPDATDVHVGDWNWQQHRSTLELRVWS